MPEMTVARLAADLRRLGVAPGDVVMLHASLKAIGPVEGGAMGVVRALDAAVGADGTLLMVLLRDYLATHAVARGPVGGATSELVEAGDLVAFATGWMTTHLAART